MDNCSHDQWLDLRSSRQCRHSKCTCPHGKVIGAGVGYSLLIEIAQLPFFDRVSDIDDLILNSLGFLMGYGIYLLVKAVKRSLKRRRGRK